MKQEGISIPYPTQTITENFKMSDHCREVLTFSMINREALDVRSYSTQVREGCETGMVRSLDM